MTAENFAYWLQGYAELFGKAPTIEQWEIIKSHLGLVFNKVTPSVTEPVKQMGSDIDWSKYLPQEGPKVPEKKGTFWIDLPKETDKGFFPSWYEQYGSPVEPDGKKFVLTC